MCGTSFPKIAERAKNWNLWGHSVGALDFSPDWKHRYFGTEVPGPNNDKYQFIAQSGGFFQNVADISILYKIFGTRRVVHHPVALFLLASRVCA